MELTAACAPAPDTDPSPAAAIAVASAITAAGFGLGHLGQCRNGQPADVDHGRATAATAGTVLSDRPSGTYLLVLHTDGQLAITKGTSTIWSTTARTTTPRLVVETNRKHRRAQQRKCERVDRPAPIDAGKDTS